MIGGKWKRASCTLPTSGAGLVCRSCVVQGGLRCYYSGTIRCLIAPRLSHAVAAPLSGFVGPKFPGPRVLENTKYRGLFVLAGITVSVTLGADKRD
jgi:hypothetical protein